MYLVSLVVTSPYPKIVEPLRARFITFDEGYITNEKLSELPAYSDTVRSAPLTVTLFQCSSTVTVSGEACINMFQTCFVSSFSSSMEIIW